MENPTISEEELIQIQKEALEKLEKIIDSCDDINALVEQISNWKDEYSIIDIDNFFIDDNLRIHARNLLSSKFEKLKKETEAVLNKALNMASQKQTFLGLYTICSDAKNYKDFEVAQEKLREWLKAHPKNTWENFNENYQKFFEKFANEDYLSFITGYSKQEKIVSTLEEIVDYSIKYSDFAFFQENLQIWESEYANRDNFLNSQNKEKIANLLKDTTEQLTPHNFQTENLDSPVITMAYYSFASTIASSSNNPSNILDWVFRNMPLLSTLSPQNSEKFSKLLSENFPIITVTKNTGKTSNFENNVIKSLIIQLNSNSLDEACFMASLKNSPLSTNTTSPNYADTIEFITYYSLLATLNPKEKLNNNDILSNTVNWLNKYYPLISSVRNGDAFLELLKQKFPIAGDIKGKDSKAEEFINIIKKLQLNLEKVPHAKNKKTSLEEQPFSTDIQNNASEKAATQQGKNTSTKKQLSINDKKSSITLVKKPTKPSSPLQNSSVTAFFPKKPSSSSTVTAYTNSKPPISKQRTDGE